MAIYHCSTKLVSRSAGRSATAAAAYRAGEKIKDTRTGEVHDYTRKRGILHTELVLPDGVTTTRQELWNAAETAEKRKDGRVAREWEIALPAELTDAERTDLARDFARALVSRYGVAADMCIHAPSKEGDQRNYHAHILTSTRSISAAGLGQKTEIEREDKQLRQAGLPSGRQQVDAVRQLWAEQANRALARAGQHERIDHRSLKEQGLRRMPTLHLGASASSMERKGQHTRIGDRNRAAIKFNARLVALEMEVAAHSRRPDPARPLGELDGAALVQPIKDKRAAVQKLYNSLVDLKHKIDSYKKNIKLVNDDISKHNEEYSKTGIIKKMFGTTRINKEAERLVAEYEKNKKAYDEKLKEFEKIKLEHNEKEKELTKLENDYRGSPHHKAVTALDEKQKKEQEAAEAKRVKEAQLAKEREAQERRQKIDRETLVYNLVQCGQYWTGTVQEKKARREAILAEWDKATPDQRVEMQGQVKTWLANQREQERSRSRSGPSLGR